MSKRRPKIELRHSERPPTKIVDCDRLIVTTPSGQGFAIDIYRDALKVSTDGIEFLTIEPQGSNMVVLRRRRR